MSFRGRRRGQIEHPMGARTATDLLALRIRHLDVELGRPVDVLLDLGARRALGLEVRCRDEAHRFLPLAAARIDGDAVALRSPLLLLDDLAFYRARGSSLRSLRGTGVGRAGRRVGVLDDVLIAEDGALDALLVETGAGVRKMPFAGDVELEAEPRASAA
jgi:hypothetical protein